MYGASKSRNSERSLTADSERISMAFIIEMMKVVRNCVEDLAVIGRKKI
jgi:hypothetical protein